MVLSKFSNAIKRKLEVSLCTRDLVLHNLALECFHACDTNGPRTTHITFGRSFSNNLCLNLSMSPTGFDMLPAIDQIPESSSSLIFFEIT